MDTEIIAQLAGAGIALGIIEGIKPGPLLTMVIRESLSKGLKAGMWTAAAPIFTDGPMIIASLLLAGWMATQPTVLFSISLLGALFLIKMGLECFSLEAPDPENADTDASAYFRGKGNTVPVQLVGLLACTGSGFRLAERYFVLGTEHILLGIDHLLFVLGLLLLVRGVGPLVKTITAFTIAHSITLAAAVMGLVTLDRGPVEAAIALSIVLLAREIVVGYSGQKHLVHRRPWLVAFVFGLLHGLGFAGALGEIGLRSADVPLALLSFNLGVEAGQLAFVALLVLLNRMVGETLRFRVPRFEPAVGYALGGLAMLWLFDRLPAVLRA